MTFQNLGQKVSLAWRNIERNLYYSDRLDNQFNNP